MESKAEVEEAYAFIGDLRDAFPEVLKGIKTAQLAQEMLIYKEEYIDEIGRTGMSRRPPESPLWFACSSNPSPTVDYVVACFPSCKDPNHGSMPKNKDRVSCAQPAACVSLWLPRFAGGDGAGADGGAGGVQAQQPALLPAALPVAERSDAPG